MTEAELQQKVADYLRLQYPDVLFHSDYGSGVKLTKGQAIRQKRQNGGRRGWPDMFIAKPKISRAKFASNGMVYMMPHAKGEYKTPAIEVSGGLFLELKREDTRLVKARKPDEWASGHIAKQAEVLTKLREAGYWAEFAVGFDDAKRIIDRYLGGEDEVEVIGNIHENPESIKY